MKRPLLLGAMLALVGARADARDPRPLTVTSTAFAPNGDIPADYTCEGRSVSPPIAWSEPPTETRSLAVIVDDPDAPRGTFEHFALFNLPPSERSLPSQRADAVAATRGIAARNDAGASGFAPICPPSGRHRYRFSVI